MFKNREEAGIRLGQALENYRGQDIVVLALPHGGIEVGIHVAKHLRADFSILVVRKFPFPDDPVADFGALAEDGSAVMLENAFLWVPEDRIKEVVLEQTEEIKRRVRSLRQGEPLPEITGKTVILVDDGLTMGSAMTAAIELCRKRKAGRIIVAVPVSGRSAALKIAKLADETVILDLINFFRSADRAYLNWYEIPDEEVTEIIRTWKTFEPRFTEN